MTEFYALKRRRAQEGLTVSTHVVLLEREEETMRQPEIPIWAELLIWAGSLIFAIGMGWVAWHLGSALWHAGRVFLERVGLL